VAVVWKLSASCRVAALAVLSFAILAMSPTATEGGESRSVRFAGEILRGQKYSRDISDRLVFNLFPTDYGWDIAVWDKRDPKADFVFVVTPPYRFFNPRYIGAIYGYSAAEAVALTPRVFYFVVNREDHAKALAAVQRLSWSRGGGKNELEEAKRFLDNVPKGQGELKIIDATLGRHGGKEQIEYLKFTVELKLR
jgi:hypothetical protein